LAEEKATASQGGRLAGQITMKPLFTIHAGELLVGHEIERQFRRVNVWVPAKDTGVDLLVSDNNNKTAVSLQVKFSRDYLATHMTDELFHMELRACGWWTPERQQIEKSRAEYWIFVLVGFLNPSITDFIIIKPDDLLKRLDAIHGKTTKKFNIYLWVTKKGMCWEARAKRSDQLAIAEGTFKNDDRDFTAYLNKWEPIKALND
jgi:hypothetical protein